MRAGNESLRRLPGLGLLVYGLPPAFRRLPSVSPRSIEQLQASACLRARLGLLLRGAPGTALPSAAEARRLPAIDAVKALARLSHTESAARRDQAVSTSLRLPAVLNVLFKYASASHRDCMSDFIHLVL
jgi:hypothetical protein